MTDKDDVIGLIISMAQNKVFFFYVRKVEVIIKIKNLFVMCCITYM